MTSIEQAYLAENYSGYTLVSLQYARTVLAGYRHHRRNVR